MCQRDPRGRGLAAIAALAAAVLGASAAEAHKIKVFATVEGERVTGFVYFPGGGRATGVAVRAVGPQGSVLAECRTDAEGRFAFQPTVRCDHELVVETVDGHRATFVVKAAALPDGLAAPAAGKAADAPPKQDAEPETADEPAGQGAAPSRATLERLIAEAVQKELRPLREQLEQAEERRRLQDILGGVGYIFGLAGVSAYFLARRRRAARDRGAGQR